jgi:hypothetical protein
MRASIIGAGRSRNGIGEYIGKYFRKNGAEVTSVLGTTEKTSREATIALRRYEIDSTPYTNFYRMAEKEKPDTVVIASPSSTHYEYLVKCIEAGLNVFSEKPFIWEEAGDMERMVEDLLKKAREKRTTVAMNSQWPFAMKYYEALCGRVEVEKKNRFFIHMSPFCLGKEMIPDSVPHALSLLYSTFGGGDLRDLSFETPAEREMLIAFTYFWETGECEVLITLASQKDQPREFRFGFNEKIVRRSIDLKNYEIAFHYGKEELRIVDPLDLSAGNFIEALREKREPLVGPSHIFNTMSLLHKIYRGYEDVERRRASQPSLPRWGQGTP